MSHPTCCGCGEEILDIVLTAFNGMTWHPYHLACNTCGKDFSDGSPVEEGQDGFAYCSPCFARAFATICSGCDAIIEGEVINAMDGTYHPACFVCQLCKKDVSASFFPFEGKPYCDRCFYDVQGLICGECENPIVIGKCVSFANKKYHLEHFVCKMCKTNLQNQTYKNEKDKPYCKPCWVKHYG